ncbi:MAG TPA: hypothetical protein VH087_08805 [Thermoanaerobaculia bacterium]|jgi:hypothetical protein|nr:hypothetical protein [Thermoanaerobaculia bacterium]
MRRISLALLGTLLLNACATITSGRYEEVRVSSSPNEADATLLCNGRPSGEGKTPVAFKIRRNAGDCTLTLRKEGFEEKTVAVEQGVNPAYWGNMILSPIAPIGAFWVIWGNESGARPLGFELLGAGVAIFATDFWTGAVHAHKPATVDVVLNPR